jgi:hypothetical protein
VKTAGRESKRLEIRTRALRAKWNLERRLDVNRRAILDGGLKLPLRDRLAGEPVEAIVGAAQDAHIAHGSIGVNDRVKDHRSADILPHQLQRVRRIDFANRGGLRKLSRGRVRVAIVCIMIICIMIV